MANMNVRPGNDLYPLYHEAEFEIGMNIDREVDLWFGIGAKVSNAGKTPPTTLQSC